MANTEYAPTVRRGRLQCIPCRALGDGCDAQKLSCSQCAQSDRQCSYYTQDRKRRRRLESVFATTQFTRESAKLVAELSRLAAVIEALVTLEKSVLAAARGREAHRTVYGHDAVLGTQDDEQGVGDSEVGDEDGEENPHDEDARQDGDGDGDREVDGCDRHGSGKEDRDNENRGDHDSDGRDVGSDGSDLFPATFPREFGGGVQDAEGLQFLSESTGRAVERAGRG